MLKQPQYKPMAVEEEVIEQYEPIYEEPTVQMTQYYEVVKGDTLSRISTRTGVKVYEIQ
jgi:LysM repeat protein